MDKKALLLIILLILIILSVIVYFVSKNTHFLNVIIPGRQVDTEENFGDSDFSQTKTQTVNINGIDRVLTLPDEFEISVFAEGLDRPRHFDFDLNNNLFTTDIGSGELVFLPDNDKDGIADRELVVDDGLKNPHGIEIYDGDLYLAEEHQVVIYRSINPDGTYFKKEVLISGLPQGVGHVTRTIRISPEEKIYLSVGSSCNLCEEKDKRRAAILEYNLDGTGEKIYAEGLRNTVDFTFFDSNTDGVIEIWSVDNGRDLLGDDLPPEEINIVEEGKHYGWPYCYGDKIVNPEYKDTHQNFCLDSTASSAYNMQAHSAPLGIGFMSRSVDMQEISFPESLEFNAFVSFHGSWNRTIPTGYNVVRVNVSDKNSETIDFITGWLDESGESWGRPVGVNFDRNNVMYISDDKAGVIYRVVNFTK